MPDRRLSETIQEVMHAKGFDVAKLAQMTGVSDRYIEFLIEEKFSKLPAAPYVRGYISRISQVLGLNPETTWQEYLTNNASLRKAGESDRMPKNRFTSKNPVSKVLLVVCGIGIIISLAVLRTLYVNNPKVEFQNLKEDITIVKEPKFTIKGKIDPTYKLTLNNGEIFLDKEGAFEKEVVLEPGFNTFTFNAKKILGREFQIKKQIFYQEPEPVYNETPDANIQNFQSILNGNQNGIQENQGY